MQGAPTNSLGLKLRDSRKVLSAKLSICEKKYVWLTVCNY